MINTSVDSYSVICVLISGFHVLVWGISILFRNTTKKKSVRRKMKRKRKTRSMMIPRRHQSCLMCKLSPSQFFWSPKLVVSQQILQLIASLHQAVNGTFVFPLVKTHQIPKNLDQIFQVKGDHWLQRLQDRKVKKMGLKLWLHLQPHGYWTIEVPAVHLSPLWVI